MQHQKNQMLLDCASSHKTKEVELLLKTGAEVDSHSSNGDTALKVSAENGFTDIVNILMRAGASLETKNQSSQSVLNSAIKKNRIVTTTLLFSAMTQNQLNNETISENDTNTLLILAKRTTPRYFEKFKQLVVEHRMSIFKKLGPLFLDQNLNNGFYFLLTELQELILLYYCAVQPNEPWQDFHSKLDAKIIAKGMALIKQDKPPLLFSVEPLCYNQNQSKEDDNDLAEGISKLKIRVEKEIKPHKTKGMTKYNPLTYSPKILRKNPKEREQEIDLHNAEGETELTSNGEAKPKNIGNMLRYSPKLFRKNNHQSDEIAENRKINKLDSTLREGKEPKTKKKPRCSFLRK